MDDTLILKSFFVNKQAFTIPFYSESNHRDNGDMCNQFTSDRDKTTTKRSKWPGI